MPPRTSSLVLTLATLSAVPACANVRRARIAQDPASALPGERTPTAAELGLPKEGRVALDLLVETALRVHPSVVGARRTAEAARARIRAAEGSMRPKASVEAGASYRDQSAGATGAEEHRFESFGFDVSWLLYDFGGRSALSRQAAEQWIAAQLDVRATEVDAVYGVRLGYFELEKDIELLATARETVAQFEAHLAQVTELERVGSRIPYDVTKAKVDLGNAKLAEVQARDAILTAEATLANAVGLAESVDWQPDPSDGVRVEALAPKEFDAAWAVTLPSRPSLAAAAARERAASALIDARVAALYPSLSLGLGFTKAGANPPMPWSFNLGPSVQWTPFDGFQNLASIDESVATLASTRAARAKEEQRAWLDVRTAWIALEDAKQRLALSDLLVKSAEENLALAEGRFAAGLGTSVDLSDARQALVSARTGRIEARADRAIASARLAQAIGLAGSHP
jgi:outer membrane protein TolC